MPDIDVVFGIFLRGEPIFYQLFSANPLPLSLCKARISCPMIYKTTFRIPSGFKSFPFFWRNLFIRNNLPAGIVKILVAFDLHFT